MGSRGGVAVSLLMSTAFDAKEWLGAEFEVHGRVAGLTDRVKELLIKGFEKDVWSEDDVYEDGAEVSESEVAAELKQWKAILKDSATVTTTP